MKKKVSDNQLILIVIIAVLISSFSLLLSLTKLTITGGAQTSDQGYVNVTVLTEVSMTLLTSVINFTAANPGDSRNSYNTSEVQDCDADMFGNYSSCGLIIRNDGSVFINISIRQRELLFDSPTNPPKHYTYNVTMNDPLYTTDYGANGNCSVGYQDGLQGENGWGDWRGVPPLSSSLEVAICYLNWSNPPTPCSGTGRCYRPDVAMVEINITVPEDEPSGGKEGTITLIGITAE